MKTINISNPNRRFKKISNLSSLIIVMSFFISFNTMSQSSLDFDGKDDYAEIGAIDLGLKTQLTIMSWIMWDENPQSTSTVNKWGNIISNNSNTTSDKGQFWIQHNSSNSLFEFALSTTNGGREFVFSNTSPQKGIWYHLACVYDNTTMKIYVNGKLEKSSAKTGNITAFDKSFLLTIGEWAYFSDNYRRFTGKIDEVSIWNVALTEAEIRQRMYSTITNTDNYYKNLLGFWNFDEGNGSSAKDISANSLKASIKNGAVYTSTVAPSSHLWNGNVSSQWNVASNWFGGWEPFSGIPSLIPASATYQPIIGSTANCGSLSIETKANLTINAGYSLTLTGNLLVDGEILLKSNESTTGSLIDNGKISGAGNMKIERFIKKAGWHYFSSPMVEATSNSFWGAAVYSYDEANSKWIPVTNNSKIEPLKGYDVYYKANNQTVTLSGAFNTGELSNTQLSSSKDGYYFVGNPYPSSIDWDKVALLSTNLTNALYVWDASINNYTSYIDGKGNNGGSNIIAPTQGFWVKTIKGNSGSLVMNNGVRVHNSTEKFRSEVSSDIIRLKVQSGNNFDETTISFEEDASADYELTADAQKLFTISESIPQIYSLSNDNEELSINSLPILTSNTEIPVSFKAGVSGTHIISTSNLSEFRTDLDLFLEDKLNGQVVNLRIQPYSFEADVTDRSDRFVLHLVSVQQITPGETSSSIEQVITDQILVYSSDEKVYIRLNEVDANASMEVIDMTGKTIASENLTQSTLNVISVDVPQAYYLIKVNANGNVTTKMVYIN